MPVRQRFRGVLCASVGLFARKRQVKLFTVCTPHIYLTGFCLLTQVAALFEVPGEPLTRSVRRRGLWKGGMPAARPRLLVYQFIVPPAHVYRAAAHEHAHGQLQLKRKVAGT